MGSSNSTERLAVPLEAPSKPFLAAPHGSVLQTAMQLVIKTMPFNATRKIFHAKTNELLYEIKTNKLFSTRRTLQTPDESIVLGIKPHVMSSGLYVYSGDQTEQHSYRIEESVGVVVADFNDGTTGEACRVIIEGSSADEVVLVYLERGGSSLPPLAKTRDHTSRSRYQAVGRIQRQRRDYIVDAMPGVDVTLLLMLWLVYTDSSD